MTLPNIVSPSDITQETYENDAKAKRGMLVDDTGAPITDANPLPVDITSIVPENVIVNNESGPIALANPLHNIMLNAAGLIALGNPLNTLVQNNAGVIGSGNPLDILIRNASGTIDLSNPLNSIMQNGSGLIALANPLNTLTQNTGGVIATGNPLHILIQNGTGPIALGNPLHTLLQNASGPIAISNPAHIVRVIDGRNEAYEDTDFTAGESPLILDVNNDLGRNASDGYIVCDGSGNILVEISDNGSSWGEQFTMRAGDKVKLTGVNIDSIRLTHVDDTGYRIVVI